MKMGERIAELRKDRGYKQKEIAQHLNVAISTISNYETGCHEPDLTNLCKLADLFGVSTDYLIGRTDYLMDINSLSETVDSVTTKAQVLEMMDSFSKEDREYLSKTIRLLYYYQNCKPVPDKK